MTEPDSENEQDAVECVDSKCYHNFTESIQVEITHLSYFPVQSLRKAESIKSPASKKPKPLVDGQ